MAFKFNCIPSNTNCIHIHMTSLKIYGASKSFNNKILLNNISFECKIGEILGIFGRNGSGKSTLLKIIFGSLNADSIKLKINEEIIKPEKIILLKQIAYLPQNSFLPKKVKVQDIIPLFFKDGKKQDAIFYAPKIVSFEKKKIGELSMGELRYLELLLIGNLEHPFLLLDEPFSMIEPLFKDLIKEYLNTLKEKKGIIITDHYYTDVLNVADRCFLIKDTKKIEILNANDLQNHGYIN